MLAFFAVNQQDIAVPNQEIVLEFTTTKVTSSQARKAIEDVKQQLQSIGVFNTEVVEAKNGVLKIVYYSAIDVDHIKKILSNSHNQDGRVYNNGEDAQFPFNKTPNNYNLDVYEILKGADTVSGFKGKYVINAKHELDRFSNPNLSHFVAVIDTNSINKLVIVAQKVNATIAIAIDNSSHIIPEVRAGPMA